MTEGRGRVFSRGLSLQLQEGFWGFFAGIGQVLRQIDLLDLPGKGSWSREPCHWGGSTKRSPRTVLWPHETTLQISKGCQRDARRYWGQEIEEEDAHTRHRPALRPVCIPPPPCPFLLGKRMRASIRKDEGQIPYLHLGGRLDELCDGDLVLLEPPLDELGAADVDRAEDMPGVVLHKGAAVNDQGAFRSIPQEGGQLLWVHHLAWEPVPSHNGPVPSMASGVKGWKGRAGMPAPVSPRRTSEGVKGEQSSTRPDLLTLLTPRMPTHCAEPAKRGKEKTMGQLGRTQHSPWAKSPAAWPLEDAFGTA